MIEEVAIDWNIDAVQRKRGAAEPVGIDMTGGSPSRSLAEEHDVGDDGGAFAFESVGRQANRPHEIRLRGEILADSGILLVERVVRRHQGEDAAGPERIDRFGEEEIVQREFLAAILELEIGEGNVADRRVDAALGERRIAEGFDSDVMIGMKGFRNPSGNSVQLDCDEPPSALSSADEIADAAARLQDGGVVGDAQSGDGLV